MNKLCKIGLLSIMFLLMSSVKVVNVSNIQAKATVAIEKHANNKSFFTNKEQQQIAKYQKRAKKINNETDDIYINQPEVKGNFKSGKLKNSYVQATTDWINFYRTMFGLKKVTASSQWNAEAQYGAASLSIIDDLSHGLKSYHRPAYVSKSDWKRASYATFSSNIGQGEISPRDNVMMYINDSRNINGNLPGHRQWLIGGISKIGVGQVEDFNDIKVFDNGNDGSYRPLEVAYPRAGLTPYSLVENNAPWSFAYAKDCGKQAKVPSIKVYDTITKKNVSISHRNISNLSYGNFGTIIYFVPKNVKVNHAYTVSITHISNHKDVKYTTKLFKL